MTGQELGQQQAHPIPGYDGPDRSMKHVAGMTRREAFAMAALQGLLANRDDLDAELIAMEAVSQADLLLAELAKEAA